MILCRVFSLLVLSVAALAATAPADAREVGWSDLIDMSVQSFEDPYRDLDYGQIDALRSIIVTNQQLSSDALSGEDRAAAEISLTEAQDVLAADGIDAEWLISQRWVVAERRERAAKAGNPDIDGQSVTLTGFAIAGPPAGDGTPIVYLVPERGMCSHMPPPNPNQMIRVRLNGDWMPRYVHEPVRVSGKISITPTEEVFRVVDGPVRMSATFLMSASQVETIEDLRTQSDTAAASDWAEQLAERLRASGALRSSPMKKSE